MTRNKIWLLVAAVVLVPVCVWLFLQICTGYAVMNSTTKSVGTGVKDAAGAPAGVKEVLSNRAKYKP